MKILLDVAVDSLDMYTRFIEYLNNPQLSDGKEPVKSYYWMRYNVDCGFDKKRLKNLYDGIQNALYVTIKDVVIEVDEEQYERLMKMFEQWHYHLTPTIKCLNYRDSDDAEEGGEVIDIVKPGRLALPE